MVPLPSIHSFSIDSAMRSLECLRPEGSRGRGFHQRAAVRNCRRYCPLRSFPRGCTHPSQSCLTIRSSRDRFAASAERRKIVTLALPRSGPA